MFYFPATHEYPKSYPLIISHYYTHEYLHLEDHPTGRIWSWIRMFSDGKPEVFGFSNSVPLNPKVTHHCINCPKQIGYYSNHL